MFGVREKGTVAKRLLFAVFLACISIMAPQLHPVSAKPIHDNDERIRSHLAQPTKFKPPIFATAEKPINIIPQKKAPKPAPAPAPLFQLPPILNGLAPVISHIPTDKPVVFLTIDDGVYKDPNQLKQLQDNHIIASLFLTDSEVRHDYPFFGTFAAAGMPIENHTVNHPNLIHMTYEQQKAEICTTADTYANVYGRRPKLFRPPYGNYNIDTQRAVADCGMKAIVLWRAVANKGIMQYQAPADRLAPGDIVLVHFMPELPQDIQAFIAAQNASGLHTELLETWLATN